MKIRQVCQGLVAIVCVSLAAHASEVVSPFAGSEFLGEYRTDFDRFQYLSTQDGTDATLTTEGRLVSRVYRKPAEKSTYEVFRSYEKELKAAGFTLVAAIGDDPARVRRLSRAVIRDGNRVRDRNYSNDGKPMSSGNLDYLATFGERYIAAHRKVGGIDVRVVVLLADRRDLYLVDVLESAAMEEDTVALTLDGLRAQMESEGRVAVYGILFDTGSARITPDSAATLEVIAQYLRENVGRSFYVVGHTDDQGSLDGNMGLAQARAEASVKALVGQVPGAASRLSAHGVGPLAPVASNTGKDGRQLNRRVELVLALN